MAGAAAGPAGAAAGSQLVQRQELLVSGFVYESKYISAPKIYILQPWIVNLLLNSQQVDTHECLVAGQVLRVLRDSTAPGQPGVLQDAVLQVSDGSYYIRVVITSKALQADENTQVHVRLSSLICRIIVLQKYTVCFREEARLEDCEFYLTAQQFIVLPMERQRMEASNGNEEPSVLQKIKELWMRSLALENAASSEASVSQLIDAIGQNQLEVLKKNAEECLDLWMPNKPPAAVKDEVSTTKWEAQCKKKWGEDVFIVPANTLLITSEEDMVACDASKADTIKATPGKSGDSRMVPSDASVISQVSSTGSIALSETSEVSLDNPWNRLAPVSLVLESSDESFQHSLSLKTQQDMAVSSNTPNLLEQGQLVETSSPSLLCSYGDTSLVETSTTYPVSASEAACDAPCTAGGLQVSGGSQATLPSLSPAIPVLPSSRLQSLPKEMPCREHTDSSGTAFPPDTLKCGPAHARTPRGGAACSKRKLLMGDGLSGQKHPRGAPWDRGRDTGRQMEPESTQGAKKRREETELLHGKEPSEEEEEQACPVSGSRSKPEQHRALQPYVNEKPVEYKYNTPSPELCKQIRSVRISKAMLKWACWILTGEMDS
ncbi:adrenocortical dysplasia protein-like [Falco naumanni]|uniref:adrenocortical dysplasia protein-like n=1 Tax=Falco naumanni TaxID=148594 RepID=UPI001ADE5C78|nr:adrenocortical dysplasia protein-like [Falco naumanni]